MSGPLYPWSSTAAEPAASDIACQGMTLPQLCQLSSRVKYALRGKGNEGLDFGASFGEKDPAKVGQDLYLTVYNKTVTSPFEGAIKATAAQYGLPPERMSLILGGDITPILERSPLLRIEDAVKIYNQMIATFNDKKNSLDIRAKITSKVELNEMFADGDTENSGFDLVNDLANIEIILFKKNDPVSFGESYSPNTDDGSDSSNSGSGKAGDTSSNIPIDLNGQVDSSGNPVDPSKSANTSFKNPFLKVDALDPVFIGGINPNQCFAAIDLDEALNKFAEEAGKNAKLKSTNKDQATEVGDKISATGGSDGESPEIGIPDATTTQKPIAAAPPADYEQPAICDDIVCISLDFIKTPAKPSFSQSDNCVLCHVQFINESLKKTISHSLIPGKASGNLGESGLCKNAAGIALGSVGMNISLKTVPMITPAKDDLIKLGNIGDEWDRYAKDNGFWNYSEKKKQILQAKDNGGKIVYTPTITALERQLIVEIGAGSDDTTQQNVLAKAEKSYGQIITGEKQQLLVAEISKEAFGQASTLQALTDEMKQMNGFFLGFQKQLRTLFEDVPGVPGTKACVKLNNKEQCS